MCRQNIIVPTTTKRDGQEHEERELPLHPEQHDADAENGHQVDDEPFRDLIHEVLEVVHVVKHAAH